MGLDASAKFFYGMPLSGAYHELQQRGQRNGKRRCLKCGKVVDSKFCPDDGENCEPIVTKIDMQDLCEEEYGKAGDLFKSHKVEMVSLDDENEDAYYLIIKESMVRAGDLRHGGAGATPLGKFPGPPNGEHLDDWDDRLKAFCQAIEIEFEEPQFFFGLYLSY